MLGTTHTRDSLLLVYCLVKLNTKLKFLSDCAERELEKVEWFIDILCQLKKKKKKEVSWMPKWEENSRRMVSIVKGALFHSQCFLNMNLYGFNSVQFDT